MTKSGKLQQVAARNSSNSEHRGSSSSDFWNFKAVDMDPHVQVRKRPIKFRLFSKHPLLDMEIDVEGRLRVGHVRTNKSIVSAGR